MRLALYCQVMRTKILVIIHIRPQLVKPRQDHRLVRTGPNQNTAHERTQTSPDWTKSEQTAQHTKDQRLVRTGPNQNRQHSTQKITDWSGLDQIRTHSTAHKSSPRATKEEKDQTRQNKIRKHDAKAHRQSEITEDPFGQKEK